MSTTYAARPTAAASRPVSRPADVRPAQQGELRLTRRGRAVVFTLSLLVVLAVALFVAGGASVATGQAGQDVPTQVVTVLPGETLWGIASDLAEDGGDVRAVMAEIERLNALTDASLDAGQRLRVPLAG